MHQGGWRDEFNRSVPAEGNFQAEPGTAAPGIELGPDAGAADTLQPLARHQDLAGAVGLDRQMDEDFHLLAERLLDQGALGSEASWAGGGIVSPLYPWRYRPAVTALAHWSQDFYPRLGERYRHHYLAHQNDLSLFEGVLPMLAELKGRHHWLTVATGKSRSGLNEALQAVELRGVFDGSRTADETAGKPNPLMLNELMREFGAEPERTLMIGDTTHDLQMAVNAGCASVGVSYGAHDHGQFEPLNPRFIAHSVKELHDWLLANA